MGGAQPGHAGGMPGGGAVAEDLTGTAGVTGNAKRLNEFAAAFSPLAPEAQRRHLY